MSEDVAIDASTGRVSILNVLEDVRVDNFPAQIVQAVAISAWNLEQNEFGIDFQAIFRVHHADRDPEDFPINFTGTTLRHRVMVRLRGLQCRTAGPMRFEVLLNGRHCADHRIVVSQQQAAGPS